MLQQLAFYAANQIKYSGKTDGSLSTQYLEERYD